MRDSRDIRGRQCGNVKWLNGPPPVYFYLEPSLVVRMRDPVLATLLDRRLAGEYVDLRKHLTRR